MASSASDTPSSAIAPPPALETGVLPASWAVVGSDCVSGRHFRAHEYNATFIIIRQSGCTNYEKPFLYLLIGTDEALLLDTGASRGQPPAVDRRPHARAALPRAAARCRCSSCTRTAMATMSRVMRAFLARPNTRLIQAQPAAIAQFFGLTWPTGTAQYDLGNRVIDIVPIPGHEAAHIAVYDRRTGILLTGDTLYPGRLYVSAQQTFRDSVDRLVDFTLSRPIAHVLGAHIEQKRTPFLDYPIGTTQQPEEHVLELGRSHILELQDALRQMPGPMVRTWLRDFIVWP